MGVTTAARWPRVPFWDWWSFGTRQGAPGCSLLKDPVAGSELAGAIAKSVNRPGQIVKEQHYPVDNAG